mmetsp:Transcript_8602/g.39100  ORF Transcript_8602/g.39100 Transcript_8602/m.39100 type:complete len:84 (-) Transcript_8602:2959-3210(-)
MGCREHLSKFDTRWIFGPLELPAQKAKKPNHVDSYNPPFEYQVGDEGASEMNGRDHNATHATYTALRRVRTIFLPRGSQTYET